MSKNTHKYASPHQKQICLKLPIILTLMAILAFEAAGAAWWRLGLEV